MYRKMQSETSKIEEIPAVHLECVDKISKLPVVEMVVSQTAEIYDKVKGSSSMANWTLSTAEATVNKVVEAGTPVAKRLEQPIHLVDQTVCLGISTLEDKIPMVKEHPQEIYAHAKGFAVEKASVLKDYSWNKANDMLLTKWGAIALTGFEKTATWADKYIDLYLPERITEATQADPQVPIALPPPVVVDPNDKVTATLSTMSQLSNKVRSRLYQAVLANVQGLKKQSDDSLTSLGHLLELVANNMHVDPAALSAKVNAMWVELSSEDDEDQQGQKTERSKDQVMLIVARKLAARVATFCSQVPSRLHDLLPTQLAQQMEQATAYAGDLRDAFMQKTGLRDMSENVRASMKDQVTKLQFILQDFNLYTVQLMDVFSTKKQLTEAGEPQSDEKGTN